MNARHRLLLGLAAGAAAFVGMAVGSAAYFSASEADVVIAGAGGIAQDAQRIAMWQPAAKALGFTISEDTAQSWTEARAQVDAGAVTWDVISPNMGEVPLAVKAGILEKLPPDIVDRKDFLPGSVNDYCVGSTAFSTVIGYSTAKFGKAGPANMADFWNVKKFPGRRGMFRNPRGNVEAAILALGYPQSQVYEVLSTPNGRKMALDKLAQLKPHVVWWESGAQATQLVKDGEVSMIYGWAGRILAAIDDGAPFKVIYKDGLLDNDCYAIVKGAPHRANAIKFIKEISKTKYARDLPKFGNYGSPNLKAYAGYDRATLSRLALSPENAAQQYRANVDFWGTNGTTLSEGFDYMLLSQ